LAQGHTIGCHTKSHAQLGQIQNKDTLYEEIIESGNELEQGLKININYFAYPFGDINSINSQAIDLIKKKYEYCFSGIRGLNAFPVGQYAVKRDNINIQDPKLYNRFIIEGGLDKRYKKKFKKLLSLTKR